MGISTNDDISLQEVRRALSSIPGSLADGVSSGLRTLDALQPAVALDMLEASWISVMLSADKGLCEVAKFCGCPAVDPAKPGLIQG